MMYPAQLPDEIRAVIDRGDVFLDAGNFSHAICAYREALAMIPEPKYLHEVALCAYTALGEAHFFAAQYREALAAFREALKAPDGPANPLLHLRLGQTYFEMGDLQRAVDSLTRAYALDGRAVFDGEDDKYLSFLATKIEM